MALIQNKTYVLRGGKELQVQSLYLFWTRKKQSADPSCNLQTLALSDETPDKVKSFRIASDLRLKTVINDRLEAKENRDKVRSRLKVNANLWPNQYQNISQTCFALGKLPYEKSALLPRSYVRQKTNSVHL